VLVYLFHQIVTQQNAMDGVPCQLHTFSRQNNLQLTRTPIGITPSHFHYLLF
jgi:hypothetical protein